MTTSPTSSDRSARAVVWGLWGLGAIAAVAFVWVCGPPFPYQDDFALVTRCLGIQPVTFKWLWGGYNDHRYALSWLILYASHQLSGGEHRVAMTLQVAFLAGASALLLIALRRARGRTRLVDAAIPLAWLHWGHWWNLLMSFQLWLILSMALIGAWIAFWATPRERLRPGAFAAVGVTLLVLPLLAGSGALSTPALAGSVLAIGMLLARRGQRASGVTLIGASVLALALFVAYVSGFERSFTEQYDDSLSSRLVSLSQFAGLAVGPSRWSDGRIPSALATLAFLAATWLFARALARKPDQRVRVLGLAGALGAVASLGVGLAWGRTASGSNLGEEVRYVTLLTPLSTLALFAFELYGATKLARWSSVALLAATAVGALNGTLDGWRNGRRLRSESRALEQDVEAGLDAAHLAARHEALMLYPASDLTRYLAALREHRRPPFDRREFPADIDAHAVGPFRGFSHQPLRGTPAQRIRAREVGGQEAALVGDLGELVFELPSDVTTISGRFGLVAEAALEGRSDGVVFAVESRPRDEPAQVLFEQEVMPVAGAEAQPEHAFEVHIAPGLVVGEIALVTRNAPGREDRWDRGYWLAVTLR